MQRRGTAARVVMKRDDSIILLLGKTNKSPVSGLVASDPPVGNFNFLFWLLNDLQPKLLDRLEFCPAVL